MLEKWIFPVHKLSHCTVDSTKFSYEASSINHDGTLIITFNDKGKMERYETIELEYNSLYFKYELIETEIISGEYDCPNCGDQCIKTTYHASTN